MLQKDELPEELLRELGIDNEPDDTEAKKKLEEIIDQVELNDKAVVACSDGLVDVVQVSKQDIENLIYYADTAAKILKDNGWPGKAEALENRYMKIAVAIGLKDN